MRNLKKNIIQCLKYLGLYNVVYKIYFTTIALVWHFYGILTNRNETFLKNYIQNNPVHKLHLGCGLNYLDGWVNTDLKPNGKRIYLDVSKKFPFPDNSFDFAFTEHVIEHMPYACGKSMLQECFRVLKPNGVLRVVTPDLKFLINLYQNDQEKINKDYIEWNSALFIKDAAPHDALSVLNNYVRDWGHKYIYDIPALSSALKSYGYVDIKEQKVGKSEHSSLNGLEHESRHPVGFLALESLVIEARKP